MYACFAPGRLVNRQILPSIITKNFVAAFNLVACTWFVWKGARCAKELHVPLHAAVYLLAAWPEADARVNEALKRRIATTKKLEEKIGLQVAQRGTDVVLQRRENGRAVRPSRWEAAWRC